MYKPITYNTNLLTEETDSFVNKLDPSKVFKSKNKTIIPKKKGPVQSAGGQKGPSGPASTSKSSSGSGNPVRKWAAPSTSSPAPQWWSRAQMPWAWPNLRVCVWNHSPLSVCTWSQQKAEKRFLSPSEWQNPRPFTHFGLSQELEGHIQVSPRILPHTHYSRLRHLLLLGDLRNVRFYVSD